MAISVSNLTSNSSAAAATTKATASISPTANALILAWVVSGTTSSTNPNQPTLSGNGLTWEAIGTSLFDNASTSRRRITLFRSMGASPSSGAATFSFGGQSQAFFVWGVDQATGVDTTGTNGSGAVGGSGGTNIATNQATGGATSLTVTLSSFSDANNATYGCFGFGDSGQTQSVGSGFTSLVNIYDGGVTVELGGLSEYKTTNDTGVDVGSSASTEIGGIAIEINAAAVAASTQAAHAMLMGMGQ